MLAARNPNLVSNLILSSPPSWKDMTTAIPESDLQRNYHFLSSSLWGNLAFSILETKVAIKFFSNAFLFRHKCDEAWLHHALAEVTPLARPPVQVFNAGFLNHRSYEEELTTLITQPTLILSGTDDPRRVSQRDGYQQYMKHCQLETIPGKNVLAWESPKEFVQAVSKTLLT
jgi:pimeloyl-ACP methyl ester carboxylesterase